MATPARIVAENFRTRIAVTGAGGFVGGALARAFSKRADMAVFPLCRPAFDLCDARTFDLIPRDIDVLVHAAGMVGDGPDAREQWQVNLLATHALVQHLGEHPRPPYLLFLSTGGVHGPTDGRITGLGEPKPKGLYALTKYLAEEVVRHTCSGPWAIARLYFPYGPGQSRERLIPRLALRIAAGDPVTLNRDGRPAISPIHIDDLVTVLSGLVDRRVTGVHEVAGGEILTIAELAAALAGLLDAPLRVIETGASALDHCTTAFPGIAYTPIRTGLKSVLADIRG